MTIKRSAVLLAGMAAAFFLSGCGNKPPENTIIANNTLPGTAESPAGETQSSAPEKYRISCAEIAYKTLQADDIEIPQTMEVTDDTMLSEVMGYDMSIAEDYSVYTQLVSADLFELAVIRADDGNIDAVKKMLADRRDYLINQAAFYPAQVEAAEATIVSELNGYCFLICSAQSEAIEKHVLYYIMLN